MISKGMVSMVSGRVSTKILGQLRVTSTQFQEKYPYIARNGKGYLTLKLNNLGSVLKFWASTQSQAKSDKIPLQREYRNRAVR